MTYPGAAPLLLTETKRLVDEGLNTMSWVMTRGPGGGDAESVGCAMGRKGPTGVRPLFSSTV